MADQLGEEVKGDGTRWQTLLQSGCRTGAELASSWDTLQSEARDYCEYLGKDFEDPLSGTVESVGYGSTDGSTRGKLVRQREEFRGAALSRALELHYDQHARPVWVSPQLDKLSSSWLLALPGPTTGLTSPVFMEALASHLCLPSPACQERLGEAIGAGRATVDHFGDNVMAAFLPGDSWRTRHDTIKTSINSLCLWSGLRADVEVFGLFGHLIPAVSLDSEDSLSRGRKRQGLVPDFRLELPNALGTTDNTLAELKVIGAVCSRYPRGVRSKVVTRRANFLQNEYVSKVAKIDQQILGFARGQVGPLQRKLQSYGDLMGLVVGAYGEGSEDLHRLTGIMAECRLKSQGLSRGRVGSDAELGVITGQIRRLLSTTAVRAQAMCLIGRLDKIGEGQRAAGKRRVYAKRVEERLRAERSAQWLMNIRGRGIVRKGQFMIP